MKYPVKKYQPIIYSSICCNDIVMAEVGGKIHNDAIFEVALSLMKQYPDPGHVFIEDTKSVHGMKVQLYEKNSSESNHKNYTENVTCWSFTVIYEPSVKKHQAKRFLDTIIRVTESHRENNILYINNWTDWKELQEKLSPILMYFMQDVKSKNLSVCITQTRKYAEYEARQGDKYRNLKTRPLKKIVNYDNGTSYENRQGILGKNREQNKSMTHVRDDSLAIGYGYDTGTIQKNPCGILENLVSCVHWY